MVTRASMFEIAKDFEDVLHVLGRFGGIGAGGAEHGAAAQGLVLDVVDGQPADEFAIALDEPFEAVADAEDLDVIVDGFDGHGTDDAVDPRGRAASDEKCQPFDVVALVHENIPPYHAHANVAEKLFRKIAWGYRDKRQDRDATVRAGWS